MIARTFIAYLLQTPELKDDWPLPDRVRLLVKSNRQKTGRAASCKRVVNVRLEAVGPAAMLKR
jgi:hypothetical protein